MAVTRIMQELKRSPKLRVWCRPDGRLLLGPGRLELLETVAREPRLGVAARALALSARRARTFLRRLNRLADGPLVDLGPEQTATLTAEGRATVVAFRTAADRLRFAATGPCDAA